MFPTVLLAQLEARDRALFLRWALFDRASQRARMLWRSLTHLGGTTACLLAASLPLRVHGALGTASHRALAILVLSHLVVQLVKRTVGRPRPAQAINQQSLIAEPDRFSFPSGHSAASMAIALAYASVFPSLAIVLVPLALLVGASRVCLGVHYPGDVVIGQLIAALTALPVLLG